MLLFTPLELITKHFGTCHVPWKAESSKAFFLYWITRCSWRIKKWKFFSIQFKNIRNFKKPFLPWTHFQFRFHCRCALAGNSRWDTNAAMFILRTKVGDKSCYLRLLFDFVPFSLFMRMHKTASTNFTRWLRAHIFSETLLMSEIIPCKYFNIFFLFSCQRCGL